MEYGFRITTDGLGAADPEDLREDIGELYLKYHKEFKFRVPSENNYNNERRFYVYEWFTQDEGKIFYVGKGTGKRYNHVLSEIGDEYRGIYYKELQNNFGIAHHIIADNLTNLEAEIYEICWIHERTSQGEVLLQFADMPIDMKENLACLKKS